MLDSIKGAGEGKGKQKEELTGTAGKGKLLFSQGQAVIVFLKGLQASVGFLHFPRETELLIPSRKSSAHGREPGYTSTLFCWGHSSSQPFFLSCLSRSTVLTSWSPKGDKLISLADKISRLKINSSD